MPLAAVWLLVVSGVFHAIWNLLVKRAAEPSAFFAGAIAFAVALYTPVFVIVVAPRLPAPTFSALAAVLFTGLAEGVYFVLLTLAYRRGDLSLVYPISRGTAPLFIVAGGVTLLAERIPAVGYAGIGLVVAGVVAVAWPGRGVRVSVPTVVLSALTGATIAAHHLGYKWLFRYYPPYAAIYMAWLVAAVVLTTYVLISGKATAGTRYVHDHLVAVVAAGVLSMGGFLLVLLALDMTLVSYIGAARNVGTVLSVLLGAHFLAEGGRWRRLAGAVGITVGVIALVLA